KNFTKSYRKPLKNIKPGDKNRIFLASRPTIEGDTAQEPLFNVESLDMEQVRNLAETFYGENTDLYKEFDKVVPQEEVVKKVAGTPLTALLVIVYYQVFRKFDTRYRMYDLLLKFLLLTIWQKIKAGSFKRTLEDFFIDARKELSEIDKDAASQYDALSQLSYECLYEPTGNAPLRNIPSSTLKTSFQSWLEKEKGKRPDQIESEINKWLTGLVQEQILIPSGFEEYAILHSTIMEFLAARWIVEFSFQQIEIKKIIKQDVDSNLETLPIVASKGLNIGYEILHKVKKDFPQTELENRTTSLFYRILCELEGIETEELEGQKTVPTYEKKINEIKANRHKVEWLYQRLAAILCHRDKKSLEEALKYYQSLSKLSRNTLLEYMIPERFLDVPSDLEDARMQLIKKMMREGLVDEWLKARDLEKWG
ncbi:MAG: hypothetical protein AAB267_04435, partial [Candidatus Desantisbacteria bacterium]